MIKKELILMFILAIIFGMLTYFLLGEPMNQLSLTLTSTSFKSGQEMPRNYTCDGENISPQFSWNAVQAENLKSYVLIIDDPDAKAVSGKTFVHWIVLLSPNSTELSEGAACDGSSTLLLRNEASAKELRNDFEKTCYSGPCPPHGTHTYRCTLFATTETIDSMDTAFFKKPFDADEFRKQMGSRILAQSVMTATYTRVR